MIKHTAVLIDPFECSLTTVYWCDFKDWYKLIDCACFDMATLSWLNRSHSLALVLDDTGLYRDGQRFFKIPRLHKGVFAGKGLFVINDRDSGDTLTLPFADEFICEIMPEIAWVDPRTRFAGCDTTEHQGEVMPGVEGFIITSTPRFKLEEEDTDKD